MSALAGPRLALSFLTVVPAGRVEVADGAWLARAAAWFPVVGALVGGVAAGTVALGDAAGLSHPLAGAVALAAAIVVTRGLHEDGLADTADGLGVHGTRERRLAAMKDSAVGAHGALAMAVALLLAALALASLDAAHAARALVAAHVASRAAMVIAAAPLPPAGATGLGRGLAVSRAAAAAAVILTVGTFVAVGAPVALAAVALALATAIAIQRRAFGGRTGDTLGATGKLVEVVALIALSGGVVVSGALLVCGTASDAGKSLVTAGICRSLARRGVSVAPFKAQNMANNSAVTASGAEIGRAQAMQAAACGIEPESAMNPVLIKPAGETSSQVLLMGKPYANATARSYQELKASLEAPVLAALTSLRGRYDAVICEGAGSPAEINLRARDLANMGLARAAGLPVLLVGDIDRGGVFAQLVGTLAVLDAEDQRHIAAFLINKFRGDASVLAPGLEMLHDLTGRRSIGTLPWREGVWLDAEDSLALQAPQLAPAPPVGRDTLDVVVLRLSYISNFTDVDALAAEPGVGVRYSRSPVDVERADLVVIPGSKNTVGDLQRLRADGLDRALLRRAREGAPILGICGGYQLLGERIDDDVESRAGVVDGLGLLPVATTFHPTKLLRRQSGTGAAAPLGGAAVSGYEIRHGDPQPVAAGSAAGAPLIATASGEPEGWLAGAVAGTSWHGLLEGDAARRALLRWVADARGREWRPGDVPFATVRERQLDLLGDLIDEHVDRDALDALLAGGVPEGLPILDLDKRTPRMLRVLSHADTDLLAITRARADLPAGFPEVRVANPAGVEDLDALLDGARVVVVRLLGGRRAWEDGVETLRERAARDGFALLLLGGEPQPDAELAELSAAPAGALAQAFEYLRHGGVGNATNLLRFLADTFLLEGYGFEDPEALEEHGGYAPDLGDAAPAGGPRVGIVFYRSHLAAGNTAFVDELARAVVAAGGTPTCVWAQSLRPDADGRVAVLEALQGKVEALIVTVLAGGGSTAADEGAWRADALAALGVPVVQAVCVTRSRAAWQESPAGLSPMDVAMQVAIPEFDGRLLGGVVSFKEPHPDFEGVSSYVPDAERCAAVAGLTVRIARLRDLPPAERRVVVMLSAFPTKHGRIGNAVGLDTPASGVALLNAMRDAGYRVDAIAEDGDALIHGLIAAGGYDPDHLTDAQLSAAVARLPVAQYLDWFEALPEELKSSMIDTWGPPPGTQWRDGDDLVLAGLDLGGVFVAIQPPRGYGEDPSAIYHDPELAPSHHYLASYWWLDRVWGADALVHLGKHGTLEWLPGKSVGLSAACAPDAALGTLPVVYPFVVNDPGEGVQAKRRMHATIVDHLIPPMARAGTHDELAALEDLLDEYARMEALDPSKLPALGTRIWEAIQGANLHKDLGLDDAGAPEDEDAIGTVIEHLDTYLCEVKDLQVRDGLHVLGHVPEGEPLRNLVAAIMRLPNQDVPALRRAIGRARDVDELALIEAGDRVALDRLDAAQDMVLDALSARGWDVDAVGEVARNVLDTDAPDVLEALRFAAGDLVPRLRASGGEIDSVLHALSGGFVDAGPSGSPTRGRVDVLPTGRNFYGVDPKALPSQLSWDVGVRLGDALLERHVAEDGRHPETVGIVVWGTAAMRTHGDDVAEILHLLGVRPVWNADTRRVTGLEVVPLEQLGRPRIDVVVRISGFFRDAFPHLVSLIDDAVTTVAALDERDDDNYVRKHARADAERLADELGEQGAWRRSTARVFGSRPGSYGAGLLELIDARNWRDDADLAAVYEAWGGHAYGAGLDGVEARGAVRDCFARIEVAVKNIDNREHDLFDSDGYFQYHGGMVAAVRALSGRDPKAWVGDSADPARVRALSLAEEARRVFRARVTNPRWIGAMVRHGYKGAFELAATVDYLFGYDATTGVIDDWMYEAISDKYVRDPDVGAFLRKSNPWALHDMAERLLEAADRGLWAAPEPGTLDALRDAVLDVEEQLEEAGEGAQAS